MSQVSLNVGEHCSGKTLSLIKIAAREWLYIVSIDKARASYAFKLARENGYEIPFPITYGDFMSGNYCGKNINGFLFDDVQEFFQRMSQQRGTISVGFSFDVSSLQEVSMLTALRNYREENTGGRLERYPSQPAHQRTLDRFSFKRKHGECCECGSYEHQVPMPINGIRQDIDVCISDIVAALNAANIATSASCCGHGKQHGTITMEDGRELSVVYEPATAWKSEDRNGKHE